MYNIIIRRSTIINNDKEAIENPLAIADCEQIERYDKLSEQY